MPTLLVYTNPRHQQTFKMCLNNTHTKIISVKKSLCKKQFQLIINTQIVLFIYVLSISVNSQPNNNTDLISDSNCTYESEFVASYYRSSITCTKYASTLGTAVDLIRRTVKKPENIHKLQLNGMTFPNLSLIRGWYNGWANVTTLQFVNCNVDTIDFNSFDGRAFDFLNILEFVNIPFINFELGSITNLKVLTALNFENVTFLSKEKSILSHARHTLYTFASTESQNPLNFDHLFGKFRLFKLNHVWISNCQSLNVLAKSNFTGLYVIEVLALKNCGIRAILNGAFDFILKTLYFLELDDNQLKTIPGNLFDQNNFIHMNSFRLMGNPIELCDCDLYELTSYFLITNSRLNIKFLPLVVCKSNFGDIKEINSTEFSTTEINQLKCANFQQIVPSRLCLNFNKTNSVAHLKSNLTVNRKENQIVIQFREDRKIRIWIQGNDYVEAIRSKYKCPNINWIRQRTKCYQMTFKKLTKLALWKLINQNEYEPIMICLNSMQYNGKIQVAPFNCLATVRKDEIVVRFDLVSIGGMCALIGVLTGYIWGIVYVRLVQ